MRRGEGAALHPESGRPQAMAERCGTCVFRAGNPMHLRAGRLADLVETNLERGAALTCHQTLSYGTHPELGPSACRGFLDAYPGVTANRLATLLLGGWHLIDPPKETP